jgi:hypothetical protein
MKISLTHTRKNKIGHNLKVKMMTVKTLTVKEIKKASDQLEQFLYSYNARM